MTDTMINHYPNVKFGTSGLRALVIDLSFEAVFDYCFAFLKTCDFESRVVFIAHDLRPSSPDISKAAIAACHACGFEPVELGQVPTPALALRAIEESALGIMITGSHIPFDRNGVKFYLPSGEITKKDETAILGFDPSAIETRNRAQQPSKTADGIAPYLERAKSLFHHPDLSGLRVGVYQHSAVGRDALTQILRALGAFVVELGRSESFVPIDTEAVSEDDEEMARHWADEHNLDAVVSTDGDGDRPWICDDGGRFLRGDILGILTAKALAAEHVVTPINCNTALELSGYFQSTSRTRIGSPYVIEGMENLQAQGKTKVVGFEANGGFLIGDGFEGFSQLPTRDALTPILALLNLMQSSKASIGEMIASLPQRFTVSDRIQNMPTKLSQNMIAKLENLDHAQAFFAPIIQSAIEDYNSIDGARFKFASGEYIHLRPSGNAPELRCYVEASRFDDAKNLLAKTIDQLQIQN